MSHRSSGAKDWGKQGEPPLLGWTGLLRGLRSWERYREDPTPEQGPTQFWSEGEASQASEDAAAYALQPDFSLPLPPLLLSFLVYLVVPTIKP